MEQLASTIGILSKHRLEKEVSMQEIHAKEGNYLEVKVERVQTAAIVLDSVLHLKQYAIVNDQTIRIYEGQVNQNEIMKALMDREVAIISISKKEFSLEDYFFEIIKED